MNYDILTVGGIMRDIIFLTKEGTITESPENPLCQRMISFELGAKVYVKKVYFEPGGGASNTAVGFSKMGLKTAIMGRVGQDREGDQLIKSLKNDKVDVHLVRIDKKVSTGFAFILSLKNRKRAHAIFAYRGTNDELVFNIKNKNKLKGIKWIYISSLSSNNWPLILNQAFNFKEKEKIKVAWNPSNVQLKSDFKKLKDHLKRTEALILNEDEAKELVLSRKKINDFRIKTLLKEIAVMGPKIVIITQGKYGVSAWWENKFYFQKPAPAEVINTTGAGDSFSAAFVSSLFYQPGNLKQALKWGVTNSASVIDQIGAQKGLLTKNQVIKKSRYV